MADAKRKVTIDGFSLEVDDTAASAIETLLKQRDEFRVAKDAAEQKLQTGLKFGTVELKIGDCAAVQTLLKDAAEQIEVLKKDVMTPEQRDAMVADWSKMIGDAKRLVPDLATDGKTCVAIRREVVSKLAAKDATAKAVSEAVLAGKTIEAADADTVRAVFNALSAAIKPAADDGTTQASDAAVAAALSGSGQQTQGHDSGPELVGRDAFLARQSKAWMNK